MCGKCIAISRHGVLWNGIYMFHRPIRGVGLCRVIELVFLFFRSFEGKVVTNVRRPEELDLEGAGLQN